MGAINITIDIKNQYCQSKTLEQKPKRNARMEKIKHKEPEGG